MQTSDYWQTKNQLKYNIKLKIYLRGAYGKFPDIFQIGTFIDSTHMKL